MRVPEFQAAGKVCEACDQKFRTKIVIGIEAAADAYSPVYLCEDCGPIDQELMQLCRELTIGCNEN
jgi:hypothetical protein